MKVIEVEASAEELRQSNTLADTLTRALRNAINPYYPYDNSCDDEEDNDESKNR